VSNRHRDQITATPDRARSLAPPSRMARSAMQTACVSRSDHRQLERVGRDIVDAFMCDDDPAFVSACMKARATLGPKRRSRRHRGQKHDTSTIEQVEMAALETGALKVT